MHPFIAGNLRHLSLSTTTFCLSVALFIALLDNLLFLRSFTSLGGLDKRDHRAFLITVLFVLLLNVLISLFAFRPAFNPLLMILLLASAAIKYFFSNTSRALINKSKLHNVLETGVCETSEHMIWRLFNHLLWFGAVPTALVTSPFSGRRGFSLY